MEALAIVYAIPVFLVLIALEVGVAWWQRRSVYRIDDAINSLSLGLLSQITAVFTRLLTIGLYIVIFDHARVMTMPAGSPVVWVGALVAYDFFYYWQHRLGHERTVLWAAHVVHHQSELYNLTTALRQTSTGWLLGWVFYVPMAIAGVPPSVFTVVALIDLLYQFWVHTELVGSLGWFDRWFASPSNHRVHHAVNAQYLDRNYGGIFMVWDRMFGTFVDEDASDPPVYGTRAPLRSWNPVWANIEVYAGMGRDISLAGRVTDWWRVLVGRTGWRPAEAAAAMPSAPFDITREPFAPAVSRALLAYGIAQYAVLLAAGIQFLAMQRGRPIGALVPFALWLVASLTTLGIALEGRRVGVRLEQARLVLTVAGLWWTGAWFFIGPVEPTVLMVATVWAVVSCVWVERAR